LFAAGTVFVVGTGLGGFDEAGVTEVGAVGVLGCPQPMTVASIAAASGAVMVTRVNLVSVSKENPASILLAIAPPPLSEKREHATET
jgi:hypothetical protein